VVVFFVLLLLPLILSLSLFLLSPSDDAEEDEPAQQQLATSDGATATPAAATPAATPEAAVGVSDSSGGPAAVPTSESGVGVGGAVASVGVAAAAATASDSDVDSQATQELQEEASSPGAGPAAKTYAQVVAEKPQVCHQCVSVLHCALTHRPPNRSNSGQSCPLPRPASRQLAWRVCFRPPRLRR
jgi:hypothetical protein